ncbi:hypothetical protein [Brevibacterium sp. ZH18]|uniref:hypothetical protein n=1 Tax=Brevibacterium sp. ZH18 TaxID=2927784 RepID=UPI001F61A1C3|nr:hypothetical protein [Brevibacterium sp. ZH18]MCI4011513.1 hypothetical protein [Brevibacterium sp. ZH18]
MPVTHELSRRAAAVGTALALVMLPFLGTISAADAAPVPVPTATATATADPSSNAEAGADSAGSTATSSSTADADSGGNDDGKDHACKTPTEFTEGDPPCETSAPLKAKWDDTDNTFHLKAPDKKSGSMPESWVGKTFTLPTKKAAKRWPTQNESGPGSSGDTPAAGTESDSGTDDSGNPVPSAAQAATPSEFQLHADGYVVDAAKPGEHMKFDNFEGTTPDWNFEVKDEKISVTDTEYPDDPGTGSDAKASAGAKAASSTDGSNTAGAAGSDSTSNATTDLNATTSSDGSDTAKSNSSSASDGSSSASSTSDSKSSADTSSKSTSSADADSAKQSSTSDSSSSSDSSASSGSSSKSDSSLAKSDGSNSADADGSSSSGADSKNSDSNSSADGKKSDTDKNGTGSSSGDDGPDGNDTTPDPATGNGSSDTRDQIPGDAGDGWLPGGEGTAPPPDYSDPVPRNPDTPVPDNDTDLITGGDQPQPRADKPPSTSFGESIVSTIVSTWPVFVLAAFGMGAVGFIIYLVGRRNKQN